MSAARPNVNRDLVNFLAKSSSLPTLSTIALEVIQHCQSENLNFNELAQVVGRDPALAVKILRMANSPIFGFRSEVRSMPQALGLLGLNCVRALVLSFSLVRNSSQEREGPLAEFWKRSVISSVAAKELSKGLSATIREEAFLAALLQDIGIMAFSKAFGNRYKTLYETAGKSPAGLLAAEKAEFGADHAEVGSWLLEKWGLPSRLVTLVRYSHDSRFLRDEDPELFIIASRVEFSARMADLWSKGDPQNSFHIAETEATALFGEGKVDLHALGTSILESLRSIAPMFELKLNDEELANILEQAEEATTMSVMRLQTAIVTLEAVATRDPLTGIYNRGSLDSFLRHRFEKPNIERMGVIFADIDHFKRINDTHGHAAGDAVIRTVAQRLTASSRGEDFVGRYGGEEFVVVVELDRPDDIVKIGERLRLAIASAPFPIALDKSLPVTISVGCVTAQPDRHHSFTELMEDADYALYMAKNEGRNRVVRAPARVAPNTACA